MKYPTLILNPCYFFCKWDVLIIRNRQKMYITRGFSNNVVMLTHKGLFSVFQLPYPNLSRFNKSMCRRISDVRSK